MNYKATIIAASCCLNILPTVVFATVFEFSSDGSQYAVSHSEPADGARNTGEDPQAGSVDVQPNRQAYHTLAQQTALRFGGDRGVRAAGLTEAQFVDVFTAMIDQESRFDPRAVSVKGAKGLGQLMPATARALRVEDPFDPVQNLTGSAMYLVAQLRRFQNVDLALAAYNAGPAAVQRHNGIPPFEETQNYVRVVTENAGLSRLRVVPINQERTTSPPVSQPNSERTSVWEF